MFELHPKLSADCLVLGDFALCQLLMMNDKQYPWFILVPRQADLSEIHQLNEADQQQFIKESSFLATQIESTFNADKINIGALGNVVPQLHIHHIVRYKNDIAWPKPVWGFSPAQALSKDEIAERTNMLRQSINTSSEQHFRWQD